MHYLYILQFKKDHRFYIGQTEDLDQRVKDHKNGKTKSTKNRGDFVLIYYEAYRAKRDATKREWQIKHYAKAKKDLIDKLKNSTLSNQI